MRRRPGSPNAGVAKGDRVLVQSKNCNQMFEAMYACFRLGAVYVPTNFRQAPDEVAYLAQASGASAMICHRDFPAHAEAARAAVPGIRFVLAIGEAPFGESYDGVVAAHDGQAVAVADVEYDDPCWFFFTSGTTGRPKAAVLTHGQMAFVVNNHLCDLMPGMTHADASLVLAPLSHGAGIHQLVQVARCVKTILLAGDRFDAAEAWSLVETWRVTNMFTVPTIVKLLTEHPAVDQFDHSSLRTVIYAGAPMYREDQKHALRKLGPRAGAVFRPGRGHRRHHRVPAGAAPGGGRTGGARRHMRLRAHRRPGRHPGRPGPRGGRPTRPGRSASAAPRCSPATTTTPRRTRNRSATAGSAPATSATWTRKDSSTSPAGPPTCTSRAGSNVYPREIEEKVLKHPAVAEVGDPGHPRPDLGRGGPGGLRAAPGAALDEAELLAWLDGQVTRYKLPKRAVFWDSLPKIRLWQDHQEDHPRRAGRARRAADGGVRRRPRASVTDRARTVHRVQSGKGAPGVAGTPGPAARPPGVIAAKKRSLTTARLKPRVAPPVAEDQLPMQVVNGAQLMCTFGVAPSSFQVLQDHQVQSETEYAANIMDHIPMTNIMPFGMCISLANPQVAAATSAAMGALTPQPCNPATTTPWLPGSATVQIAGQPALDDISTCNCMWSGVISVAVPGTTARPIA